MWSCPDLGATLGEETNFTRPSLFLALLCFCGKKVGQPRNSLGILVTLSSSEQNIQGATHEILFEKDRNCVAFKCHQTNETLTRTTKNRIPIFLFGCSALHLSSDPKLLQCDLEGTSRHCNGGSVLQHQKNAFGFKT